MPGSFGTSRTCRDSRDGPIDEMYELMRRTAETVREVDPKAVLLSPAMTVPLGSYSAAAIEGSSVQGRRHAAGRQARHALVPLDLRGYYGEFLRIQNRGREIGHPVRSGSPKSAIPTVASSSALLARRAGRLRDQGLYGCHPLGHRKALRTADSDGDPKSLSKETRGLGGLFRTDQ